MVKSGRRGKGFPPGAPATLFDPAVAVADDHHDDEHYHHNDHDHQDHHDDDQNFRAFKWKTPLGAVEFAVSVYLSI